MREVPLYLPSFEKEFLSPPPKFVSWVLKKFISRVWNSPVSPGDGRRCLPSPRILPRGVKQSQS